MVLIVYVHLFSGSYRQRRQSVKFDFTEIKLLKQLKRKAPQERFDVLKYLPKALKLKVAASNNTKNNPHK